VLSLAGTVVLAARPEDEAVRRAVVMQGTLTAADLCASS
jgi:hypothetical protein